MNIFYLVLAVSCVLASGFLVYLSSVYAKHNQFPQTVIVFSLAVATFISGCVVDGMVFQ